MRLVWLLAAAAHASQFSLQMLDSIISRKQGLALTDAPTNVLENAILGQALEAAIVQHPTTKSRYSAYLSKVLDAASANFGNATAAVSTPDDRFALATAIHVAISSNIAPVTSRTRRAYEAIAASLKLQKRNPDGGLWYYTYPEWSYLDGIFSLLPFMAAVPHANHTDMALQVKLLRDHCTQKNTSLLVHGYDWSREAVWADKDTGASPYVWGRALGWFLTGLVQTWDQLHCQTYPGGDLGQLCGLMRNVTVQVSSSLVEYADPDTGAWWQVVTLPGEGANFLESSSTGLFTFSLLKALRTGILFGGQPDYEGVARRAFEYTAKNFVTDTGSGTIGMDKTVAVCSLNSTASFEYYTSRPIVQNSLLGEAAFVLAALEMEKSRADQ